MLHSYPNVYALGHHAIVNLLTAPVVVQEKVDGSQFSWGLFNGEYCARSKGVKLHPDAPEKMFESAVEATKTLPLRDGWTYRGEFLAKPKHNALAYSRIPRQHVVLFDINPSEEEYLSHAELSEEAARLGLDVAPQFFEGELTDIDVLRGLLERESVLGGARIEGVVVKSLSLYGADKKRLMGKFVSEAYKEIHSSEWKKANPSANDVIEYLIQRYKTPARWLKAVQHLQECGKLESSPRDIGLLIKEAQTDIRKEAEEEMKTILWEWAQSKVLRGAVGGIAEWYKEELLRKQFGAAEVVRG